MFLLSFPVHILQTPLSLALHWA